MSISEQIGEIMAENKKLQEENKKLKEEKEEFEIENNVLTQEKKELKEELEEKENGFFMCDKECSYCGEQPEEEEEDGLYMCVESWDLTCWSCMDKTKKLKEEKDVWRGRHIFQLDGIEMDQKEIAELKEENKKLADRLQKFREKNWKRMGDLVEALSPWKKNQEDHKRILEAIGELKEENEKLKRVIDMYESN